MASSNRLRRWLLNPWIFFLALALVIVAGAALSVEWDAQGSSGEAGPTEAARAVPVSVETVRSVSMRETVRGVGTLRAFESVNIRPEASGRVTEINFEEGGLVEQGQMLFKLDDEKLRRQLAARRAALRAAEVRVTNAQRTFERQSSLSERGVVAPDELDRAREELDSALAEQERLEAELSLTEAQLQDMRIVAPFDGVVSERHVDRGAYVAVGETLVTVYQSDPIEIGFSLAERFLGQVRRGQPVEVSVAAYPEWAFEGAIHFISPAVDPATRTFRVRARIPNVDQELRPGIFATAVVTTQVRENQPAISSEALVATRRGYMVYVIEDDRAHRREVRTGLRREGMVEIVEGLETGEQIVRTGHLRLNDGEMVTIANSESAQEQDELAHSLR